MADGVDVEVLAGDDGLTVAKTATHAVGRARLMQEAARLDRARHPGVVELLEYEAGRLVVAWAGTPTLAAIRPPVSQAAAILAAVTSTIADLHEVGLVHSRLDPTHVVIGPDGRPRLCGMGGPPADGPDPSPADDVSALGLLIDGLLGVDVELEPIPDKRWGRRRWSGYHRRALQTLADQATDPDPARRPTARTLAAAIAEAVPDARIAPTGTGAMPAPRPSRFHLGPAAAPPTAGVAPADGFGRRHLDLDRQPIIRDIDHPFPEASVEASAAEPAQGEPVSPGASDGANSTACPEIDFSSSDTADPDCGERSPDPQPALMSAAETSRSTNVPDREAGMQDDGAEPAPPHGADADATVLGLRVDRTADQARPPAPSRPRPFNAKVRHVHERAGDGERSRRLAHRARRVPVAAGVVLLAVVAAAGWFRPVPSPPDQASTLVVAPSDRANSPASPEPRSAAPTVESVAPTTAVPGTATVDVRPCAQVDPPAADVDGDGCPEAIEVTGTSITAGAASYDIGEAGDQVAVGDWDCDGLTTAGLVRPATGEVFLFDGWTGTDGVVTVEAASVVPGARELEPGEAGADCGGPAVRLDDQSTRPIDGSGTDR